MGFRIESAATRVCREGGVRVVTNVMWRHLDLVVPVARSRRGLEIVADGVSLFGGVGLVVDASLVFSLHCGVDGAALAPTHHLFVAKPCTVGCAG